MGARLSSSTDRVEVSTLPPTVERGGRTSPGRARCLGLPLAYAGGPPGWCLKLY